LEAIEKRMEASQGKMKTQMDVIKEEMKASQKSIETAINSIRSELEEIMKQKCGRRPIVCQPTDIGPPRRTEHED
jgi:hypothetical protein